MSNPTQLDAFSSGQIFRNDNPMILAMRRDLAVILPTRLLYQAGGYVAGTVLAQNTTSLLFVAYASGGASGTGTAVCVLFENVVDDGVTGTQPLARSVFSGYVYKDLLTGLDAGAITNLGAKTIVDSRGKNILKF